jgi:hypothetical protein
MQAAQLSKSPVPAFQLSLRVRHPSMDPDVISRELKIEPEYSFCAGQPRKAQTDIATSSVHAESYWLATLDSRFWEIDISFSDYPALELDQKKLRTGMMGSLGWALSMTAMKLLRTHSALLYRIRNEGGQAGLLVALSPAAVGSFSLGAETMAAFGKLGIALEFELAGD